MPEFKGGCLCGAVRYRCAGEPMVTGHCHCIDCRRSSGTGHCTHVAIADDAFHVDGTVSTYDRPADSGNVVSRVFCPQCGSPLYSTNGGMPGMVFLRASSLDDPDLVSPGMVVYASRAPRWDHVAGDMPRFARDPAGGVKQLLKTAPGAD